MNRGGWMSSEHRVTMGSCSCRILFFFCKIILVKVWRMDLREKKNETIKSLRRHTRGSLKMGQKAQTRDGKN